MHLEYVIVKTWRKKLRKMFKRATKWRLNVETDNVTSKCAKSSDNSYIYSYSFNMKKKSEVFLWNISKCRFIFRITNECMACITMVGSNTYVINGNIVFTLSIFGRIATQLCLKD